MTICRWWIEESGEHCGAMRTPCTCSGVESQCKDTRFFNQPKKMLPRLLHLRSVERGTAQVEAYR